MVKTRDGTEVRIICTDRWGTHPIVGLVGPEQQVQCYTREGFVMDKDTKTAMDLVQW